MEIAEHEIVVSSEVLNRDVTVSILSAVENMPGVPVNLLLLNDGQETENLRIRETLEYLTENNRIKPVLVAAIHTNDDRLQEYGTAIRPDYKKRGAKAALYTQFITLELLPAVSQYTGIYNFDSKVFAGFSLGGLSAFDIAWNNPGLFNKTGVFSGSFWWRSRDIDKGYTDNDRIMHNIVRGTAQKPDIKIWLQTGTNDETADRNNNGIIDSIDDTIDLIMELENKGYSRPEDIQYMEIVGGSHNTETWAKAMPKFLVWAFGR
jgi:enterochelin esterase-like enzyme